MTSEHKPRTKLRRKWVVQPVVESDYWENSTQVWTMTAIDTEYSTPWITTELDTDWNECALKLKAKVERFYDKQYEFQKRHDESTKKLEFNWEEIFEVLDKRGSVGDGEGYGLRIIATAKQLVAELNFK
jgi:hypothetical protein